MMKARWIRNAPDAMSALYETEGGPLPRYVAAFAEQDGTVTLYESNVDGGFKKVNALKGSGSSRLSDVTLCRMGYLVTKGSLTLYPDGYEHARAPRLDRKAALDRATHESRYAEQRARSLYADACLALVAGGDATKFREIFFEATLHLERSDTAAATHRAIGKAKHDAECSKLAECPGGINLADAEIRATRALALLRTEGTFRSGETVTYRNSSPNDWRVGDVVQPNARLGITDDGIDAYARELDRMNAKLAAKQTERVMAQMDASVRSEAQEHTERSKLRIAAMVRAKLDPNCSALDPAPGELLEKNVVAMGKPGVYLDIAPSSKPTPPRPLWERALVAGSPDAPQVLSDRRIIIGRGAEMFQFGNLDMVLNNAVDRRAAALEVFKAWLQLHPGEQIENFINNNWRASTVIRPEVLP